MFAPFQDHIFLLHTPHSTRSTESSHNQPAASSDDIQRQQADLQAKILSLLGSNAVVPSSSQSSQGSHSSGYDASRGVSYPQMGGPRQYEGYSGGGGGAGGGGGGGGGYDAYGYGNYR